MTDEEIRDKLTIINLEMLDTMADLSLQMPKVHELLVQVVNLKLEWAAFIVYRKGDLQSAEEIKALKLPV